MGEVRFALIGCGRVGKKHAELLSSQVKGASLAAVCDINPERAKTFGERHGVPYFTDMHKMMAEIGDKIDVLSIATESGHHARDCIALAPYGKHIVTEKPMALTMDDADAMIVACDRAGIKLFVVKQNRYNQAIQKLRTAMDQGRFGRIVMGTVRVRWCRRQDYYDQDAWRGTWALDGGVFSQHASHHIDLLTWMLGEPETVYAESRTALVDIEAEDTGVAVLRFKSGAIGVIECTTATRPKDLEGSISILGETGTAEIGGFAANEIKIWNFLDSQTGDATVADEARELPPNVYGFGHAAYFAHVVDALTNGSPALVDGLEGRKSLEVINAIYESIETGKRVPLRFRPQRCRLGVG